MVRSVTASPWANRIVGHGEESPADLVANERNWRTHPQAQQDALAGVLDEVGFVQSVIVNQATGRLVDGHLRLGVARLLDGAEPKLLSTDPPYGVSLDPTWRDGVYNALGPAEKPYMRISASADDSARVARHARTRGHRNVTLSGDTRVDWSEAFAS